jgi:hypothetical protein
MALLSIALSSIAIWLSIHFYRLSNEVGSRVMQAIPDLTVSAKTTEATTTRITPRGRWTCWRTTSSTGWTRRNARAG